VDSFSDHAVVWVTRKRLGFAWEVRRIEDGQVVMMGSARTKGQARRNAESWARVWARSVQRRTQGEHSSEPLPPAHGS
jgi:hypothetical protein